MTGRRTAASGAVVLLLALSASGSPEPPQASLALTAHAGGAEGPQKPPPEPPDAWRPQRPEFEAIADVLHAGRNQYLGHGTVPALRQQLQSAGLAVRDRLLLHIPLVQELLKVGKVDEALEEVERALALTDSRTHPKVLIGLLELRALVFLRQGQLQNCTERHTSDCNLFPLRGGGIHARRRPAEKAKEDYLRILAIEPGNLSACWLLNMTCMFLGEYPDGVPKRHLIAPSAFQSVHNVGRFRDIAPKLGIDVFNMAGGSILEDFDNDGFLDIVTSTIDPRGPLTYFRNLGNGSFRNVSLSSRLDDQLGGLNCNAADYDNDGFRDVLVLRGAWLHEDGRIRNSLLRNNGDGTFMDVTRAAGLADPARPTQAAAWGDFDNDGDLDLYVGNESAVEFGKPTLDFPSQMFRNNGDRTFTDITNTAGVANGRFAKGVTVGDYDDDGDLDIYVSNIGPNRLYRNNGDFTFTDVAVSAGVMGPVMRSFVPWFFDYDNDGRLDLFVAAYEVTIADLAAEALGQPDRGVKPRLYRNRGDGTFENVATKVGLDRNYLPMGANFGDLDNDGFLDIYLGTGDPAYRSIMPNVMLRNDRGIRFQDVTESGGFGHLAKGHGVSFGDIDNDGDQDVFHQLGGMFPGDKAYDALFLNPGHGNHSLVIKLVGRRSNRDGIGARIKVVVDTEGGHREYHRSVGSVGSFGSSPIRQEIGLGKAKRIRSVEIRWPASGTKTVLVDVPMDGMIRVVEGEGGFEQLALRRIEL